MSVKNIKIEQKRKYVEKVYNMDMKTSCELNSCILAMKRRERNLKLSVM